MEPPSSGSSQTSGDFRPVGGFFTVFYCPFPVTDTTPQRRQVGSMAYADHWGANLERAFQ